MTLTECKTSLFSTKEVIYPFEVKHSYYKAILRNLQSHMYYYLEQIFHILPKRRKILIKI